jgi:hypothetical protein
MTFVAVLSIAGVAVDVERGCITSSNPRSRIASGVSVSTSGVGDGVKVVSVIGFDVLDITGVDGFAVALYEQESMEKKISNRTLKGFIFDVILRYNMALSKIHPKRVTNSYDRTMP